MIAPDNHFAILSILAIVTAIGILGEEKKWFKNVAGALFIIAVMAALANLGIVPSAADPEISVPVYNVVFGFFVPLAIPLLLFGANLRSLFAESRRLVIIFLLGTVGILLGAALSFFPFRSRGKYSQSGWRFCSNTNRWERELSCDG